MKGTNDSLSWTIEGRGAPLVFLHGFGANLRHWDPWMPGLVTRYTCVRIDLPGFGSAPVPPGQDYSPSGLATPVIGLIRSLDLRGCTVIGHSLGGGVGLLVALDLLDRARAGEPARLAGLVSVAGAAYPQKEPPFVHLARRGSLAALGFALVPKRWLVRTAMRAIVVQKSAVTATRVEAYAAPMREGARRRAFLDCAREIVPDDLDTLTARFPEIDVPALCLWGRQDRVVPLALGHRLADALPRGRLEVLEDCGHQVVEELPGPSLERLLSFLEGSEDGSQPSHASTGRTG